MTVVLPYISSVSCLDTLNLAYTASVQGILRRNREIRLAKHSPYMLHASVGKPQICIQSVVQGFLGMRLESFAYPTTPHASILACLESLKLTYSLVCKALVARSWNIFVGNHLIQMVAQFHTDCI